ncbi:GDSL-type esterase/lipase family protein [Parabacteroides sp. TM07-1AC]|nr:GDSL-type esterase/lipase family protein [Parabacteroides sp. TM07-1AC]
MMKQTKWFINLSVLLALIAITVGAKTLSPSRTTLKDGVLLPDTLTVPDTVALPAVSYKMGAAVDSVLLSEKDSCVSDYAPLHHFFAALDSLRAGKDTVVTVVQLGDSHIQAGHYSGRVMRLLQQQFGNAGRGWIAPFKLSKTNEPDDYFISSVIKEWVAGRCIQHNRKCPIGPGGIGIQSVSPSINFDISMAPNNGAGYSFNQAVIYRGEKSMPMLPAGKRKDSVETVLGQTACAPGVIADTFRISGLIDTLQLQSTRRKQGTDKLLPASSFKNLYYGFNLTNGKPGILYHSVGVNGAMYVNYTDEEYVRQLALLNPSLLIISLGTNETFGRRFNRSEFAGQIEDFISLVKKQMPHTAILLTTPPECYKRVYVNKKRTYVRNENTERAAKAIVDVARREGVACWDLFAATGGKTSSAKWHKAGLMGRDRVHFTKEGYQAQGTLLYRALMQTYNRYIADKNVR